MARRFVLLDRDGTIIVERHYLSDPEQVVLLPGAAEGIAALNSLGLGVVVATNQSGVGRGYFDAQALQHVHARMLQLLAASGATIEAIYVCPHRPDENCPCRKPRPGLALRAAAEWGFEPQRCWVVGDKPCDIELGQRLGAETFLVRTGYGEWWAGECRADHVVDDLAAVAQRIAQQLDPFFCA
jgi:D-glycero-D-manno-heptose 1,7-bisphosphate phosphatase